MARTSVRRSHDGALLLRTLDEGFNRATWNGTNLRASLRGITPAEAGWRPPQAKHSVAQIVLHCAYWKSIVRGRLLRDRKRTFPLEGTDWFETPPQLSDGQWADYLKLLDDAHRQLRQTVHSLELSYSSEAARKAARQVFGIAMHDVYHTGQIAMIRAQHRRIHAG
jgi:hypothetical protein